MYALIRNKQKPCAQDIEEAFDGNLCRCTGYRPILDAAQSFGATKKCGASVTNGGSGCCTEQKKDREGRFHDSAEADENSGCARKTDYLEGPPKFVHHDQSTELIFPPSLHKHEYKALAFGNRKKRWYRPVNLQQLLAIKNAFPAAKVIGGSTETQVEIKFKASRYARSIYVADIPELRQFVFHDHYLELGGNVALTDLEDICTEAVQHYGVAKAQPFVAIKKAIQYFAGRQIRNVGTPAGNLATASPISDLNPVFVATNSTLIARSLNRTTSIPMQDFFQSYRTTALPKDAIIAGLRVPVSRNTREFVRTYKQSKRKDDDIAIVNACFRMQVDPTGAVEDINLSYGGMAATTVQAKNSMEYMRGKRLADPSTLEGAINALGDDFDLRFGVPGGMATYRKTLAFGFFYRFFHEVRSQVEAREHLELDTTQELKRDISKGWKDLDASSAYAQRVVGKAQPHLAALKHCTGEAQYTDDIPNQNRQLFGRLVLSTQAHARVLSVDPAPALALAGVVSWVDRNDVFSEEANLWGAPVRDEVFFAEKEVFTAGQPIGMIVAHSAREAEVGARAVAVEYETLPTVLSIEEAVEHQSFFNHYRYIRNGDTEQTFANADHIFTGVTRMGGQEHFYLETNACLAIPQPEDGEMHIWSSTQNPTEVQAYVAQVTGVPAHKIVSKVKRLGGGFGGKETRSIQLAVICATAAKKVKQPVRCMLDRDEDIVTSGQRHPFLARWKVAVTAEGKLQALDTDVFSNGGWSQDLSGAVVDRALSHIDGCYHFPNIFVRGRVCKTNTVSNTAFRGFGGPQGMFVCEQIMEEVADHLGIPVQSMRELNIYQPDQATHFNQPLEDWHVPLMWNQVVAESKYHERRGEVNEFNRTHRWKKKGLAMIPTKFGISFTALFLNQAGALVHIYHDGSVLVAHGGTEMGQGLHTKVSMIVAEALRVPLESVFISETATNTVANTSSTAASASSDLNGYAAFNACEQINKRLEPYRRKLGEDAPLKELAHAAYFDRVNLSANGFYKTPDIGYTWGPNPEDPEIENTGKMFFYFTQGVCVAEVIIDTLTGDWVPLRTDIKMDVGRSINPAIDYGQIEGAYVQGQGLFTTEESLWMRSTGQIFTRGPGKVLFS